MSIKVGDLVRLTERKGIKPNWPRNIGLVFGFAKTMQSGWTEPGNTCAKVQWMGGSQTVTGLPMLELAQNA